MTGGDAGQARGGPPLHLVRAAGGVVIRRDEGGELSFALVHRPGHDDWSLPKGKLDAGESLLECALREVKEETGLSCAAGRFLTSTSYLDSRGRPKIVWWWLMEVLDGSFSRSEEVDELRWLDATTAVELLSYERDRELVMLVAQAPQGPRAGAR